MAMLGKDLWLIGPEEKAKHEKLFQSLNPVNGKLSGEQSKRYFMKSNLPTPVLGQIWTLADLDKDGRMTVQEFTIAVHLIEAKLKGAEIPRILPASLKSSTDPSYHGFSEANMQMPLQPMQSSYFMNGGPGTSIQPVPPMYGMPPNMGMQMAPNMGMPNVRMNYNNVTVNRVGAAPQNFPAFSGPAPTQTASLGRHSSFQAESLMAPANPPTYNYSQTLPINKSAFDSLSLDKLTDLSSLNKKAGTTTLTIGDISAPIRLKYTQMFKATDMEKLGYLTGEKARNILLQTGVNPQTLLQIWELSDITKDGNLDVDEFIIAMHLVDVVKSGVSLPATLPVEMVPPHLKAHVLGGVAVSSVAMSTVAGQGPQASLTRTGSFAEAQPSASFEDRRRMNWDKGQQELERRRRELLERQRAEKEAQEQKEREIEEQKRLMREEAEKKRLQELENERLRKEEMEREQERLRKEMIEKRLAAQLEAERKRQEEWESRRKEELMNQKDHEENIVNELKSRLMKLKGDLATETSSRDTLSSSYEKKKGEGRDLRLQIEQLNKSRELRVQEIQRLQGILQQSKVDLSHIIDEREKFSLELNQTDSTTTSEALGAIKTSVQQMKMGVTLLRGKLSSIEAQTVQVLQESNEINKQQKELNDILKEHLNEAAILKAECEQKKREEYDRLRLQEQDRRKLEIQEKKQENLRRKNESEIKGRQEREEEEMKKEKQIQVTSQRQRQEARYSNVVQRASFPKQPDLPIKLQTSILKKHDEMVQKQQDALESPKVPPARPRTRPQHSPAKQPAPLTIPQISTPTEEEIKFEAAFPEASTFNTNSFAADFSAFKTMDSVSSVTSSLPSTPTKTDSSISTTSGKGKRPPPRPKPPATKPYVNNSVNFDTEKSDVNWFDDGKQDDPWNFEEDKRKAAEKAAEKDRLEKEKEMIEKLKHEEAEKERKRFEDMMKEKEQKEKEERGKEERLRKEADVKRKVEEMQRKKLEKKQTASSTAPSDPPVEAAPIEQYTKKTMYKMLFDFDPRNPDELNVTSGSLIQVDENNQTAPPGWLFGTSNGQSGLFPANYAQKVQDTFSDYVDLDMASNGSQPATPTEPVQRKPSTPVTEQKAEEIPKLKPVPRVTSRKQVGAGGGPAKVALLPPKGPLKPLTPLPEPTADAPIKIKQTKTSDVDKEPVQFPSYDLVPSVNSAPAEASEDLYSVPPSKTNNEPTVDSGEGAMESEHGMVEGIKVIALYPYRAQKEDHLSFDKNDYINVQQQQDQWWFGESNGKNGWFPKSYVKPVGTGMVKSLTIEPVEFRGSVENLCSTPTSESAPLEECVALFDYTGEEGDLTFLAGDVITITNKNGDWWEGTLQGNSGTFPANYVQVKEAEVTKKPEVAMVTKAYTAVGENEISLKAGLLIHVRKKEGDWWQGEVQVRGKNKPLGWFPSSHVKLMSKPSKSEDKKVATPAVVTPVAVVSDYQNVQEDVYSAPPKRKDQDHVLAMFSYTAQNDDELTFCKGTVINVISKDGDWWKGEVNGQVGVFPFNYVQALRSDKPEQTSQWSGSFDLTVLKSMSPTERQRQNHIYELIKTEQDYMADLSLTLEVFYNPLAEAKILTEHELNTVFINWKELIMCNMKFLKALLVRRKMSATDKIDGIGDVLIEQLPRFSPYIRFCSCMLKACRLLQEKVEKDPEFKQFEKKCAADKRLKQNLPLSSYLLKPLQRVTKYPLIITGILNYTPEDYYDRENLMIAFEKAEELCTQINEAVRSQESSNRLEWLQERVNLDGLEENLIFNSQTNCLGQRKYLYHGTLHKHKSNKELKAFIFNDFLLLCRVQSGMKNTSGMFHPDDDTKFTIYKKPIFLNEVIVKHPADPDVNDTLFHVTHVDRVYSFRAESKVLRNSWVSQIQSASRVFIETEREKLSKATRARSVSDNGVGRLVVTIIEGADLQASDPTGFSDPYCEVSMGSQEHRTKVIQKDLNPKWNSTMVFNVRDADKDVLCISVFDRDFFSPNDFLGRTEVSVASILEKGKGPITKRLLLHEVATGEIVVTLELQNMKIV